MQKAPSLEDEEGKDDYLFMSSIPWVSFTGLQKAMHQPGDSGPRIAWGKYFDAQGKTLLPISIQAHHALIDGRHIGAFFERVRTLAAEPEKFIRI
jgi:chloramphenicol O-acetyltransferase type A